jgi:Ca2+/H+ antiporter
VLAFSRACALILLAVYMLYLFFQLRSSHLRRVQHGAVPSISVGDRHQSQANELLPRSIRFEDVERHGLNDDSVSESTKSFELQRLHANGRAQDNVVDDDLDDVPNYEEDDSHDQKPKPDQRPGLNRRERTTIYQRGRGRSSGSLHSVARDRSLSAARSASSYSRIFLGSQSTEDLSTPTHHETTLPRISKLASAILLVVSSLLVAVCAEFLINTVDSMVSQSHLSSAFIGLIILPIVGNCAEHITAVTVSIKNKLDLAIGVSVGSAIQVGLVLTPLIVLVGWVLNKEMTMYFSLFETVTVVATAFLVNFLILNGRTNYLEGSLLCACYVIIG